MSWTVLGDAIPDPLSVDDNGSSLSVDDGGGSLTVDGTLSVNALPTGNNTVGSVKITDGTNLASVFAGDSGVGGVVVGSGTKTTTWTYSTTGGLPAIDMANYTGLAIQWTTVATTGGSTFQTSNDGVNWVSCFVSDPSSTTTWITSITAGKPLGQTYWLPRYGRYFRVNITGAPSGTNVITAVAFSQPAPMNAPSVAITTAGSLGFGDGFGPGIAPYLGAIPMVYNGALWDKPRVPGITKTATATASGDTALWTPASSKKFRLMRYQIQMTADAATSGGAVVDVVLRDATTATSAAYSVYVPAAGGTAFGNSATSGWVDLGHGILSAAVNNVLNMNLSATLTSGKVRVVVAGTEE